MMGFTTGAYASTINLDSPLLNVDKIFGLEKIKIMATTAPTTQDTIADPAIIRNTTTMRLTTQDIMANLTTIKITITTLPTTLDIMVDLATIRNMRTTFLTTLGIMTMI